MTVTEKAAQTTLMSVGLNDTAGEMFFAARDDGHSELRVLFRSTDSKERPPRELKCHKGQVMEGGRGSWHFGKGQHFWGGEWGNDSEKEGG